MAVQGNETRIELTRVVREFDTKNGSSPTTRTFSEYEDAQAWVLLGDPGAGKSDVFRSLSEHDRGSYRTARDFIELAMPPGWREPIFIDGMDETSGLNGSTALGSIRSRLSQLGTPRFRLSCREADWRGNSDRNALIALVGEKNFVELHLESLDEQQILELLTHWLNGDMQEARLFVENARARELDGLLTNPQTLKMLYKAVKSNQNCWPSTKMEAYEVACAQLIRESNTEHRTRQRSQAIGNEVLLEAASYLNLLLLLSRNAAVINSIDDETTPQDGLDLQQLPTVKGAPSLMEMHAAVATRVFVGPARLTPVHRTITEFLAARYLAARVNAGLPIARVEALLLDRNDGSTVAELRGLTGWLAAMVDGQLRQHLIEADPLAVVRYGDVARFSKLEKASVLEHLARKAEIDPEFRRGHWVLHPFAALASHEMEEDFRNYLRSTEMTHGYFIFLSCVLDALAGSYLPQLMPDMLRMLHNDGYPEYVRIRIGKIVVEYCRKGREWDTAAELMRLVWSGQVKDEEDEFLGMLLDVLYPVRIGPEIVWKYFRKPKKENFTGQYKWFWYRLRKRPIEEVPLLLDGLKVSGFKLEISRHLSVAQSLIGDLLVQGVLQYGESIEVPRLYGWLELGLGQHFYCHLDAEHQKAIRVWLSERPSLYKKLFEFGLEIVDSVVGERQQLYKLLKHLYEANEPEDVVSWWFVLADKVKDTSFRHILVEEACYRAVARERDYQALRMWEDWKLRHEEDEEWVNGHLACPYPRKDELKTQLDYQNERNRREHEERQNRLNFFRKTLPGFVSGKAHLGALEEVASAYLDLFQKEPAVTPEERLQTLLDQDSSQVALAKQGLRNCLYRDDFPELESIIALSIKGSRYTLAIPALAAAELIHKEDPAALLALPDSIAKSLVAFHWLTHLNKEQSWYDFVLRAEPELIAVVLLALVGREIAAGKEHPHAVYQLAYDDSFREMAERIAAELFRQFPPKASRKMWSTQVCLLVAMLRSLDKQMVMSLLNEKLTDPRLSMWQTVNCLMTGVLLDQSTYIDRLTRYTGNSRRKVLSLKGFLLELGDRTRLLTDLSISLAGYLLEVLAPIKVPELEEVGVLYRLVQQLVNTPSVEAGVLLENLLSTASSNHWHTVLVGAVADQRSNRRQAEYRPLPVPELCRALANLQPASAADLWALAVVYLQELVDGIRNESTNDYEQYWDGDQPNNEDKCRNALLSDLKQKLKPLNVKTDREPSYADDKRGDFKVSYGTWQIPVEVKKEDHAELWTAISTQLITKYCRERSCDGFGIYLVFWFGGKGFKGVPVDGGTKPKTPKELEQRLQATVPAEFKHKIKVLVVDCSWPTN